MSLFVSGHDVRRKSYTVPLPGRHPPGLDGVGWELALGERTAVMGILNVTPDSFADGGARFDPVRAVDLLARGVDAADMRPIGLGRVNGRFFCFHTGIGYDAAVVNGVERHASLKRWLGHPLFISAALTTWLRGYDRHHPHFRLRSADGREIDDGYFAIVLNTNPYTYLGNMPIDLSPAATLDDPLVVVTFRTLRVLPILRGLGSALRGNGVRTSAHVLEWRGVEHMIVEHETPFPYQLDGDYLGDVERLEFDFVPDAVRLVFPAASG